MKYQQYNDFNNVSKGRLFLNKTLLPKYAFSCPDGSDILFVGCHKYWNYQSLWDNPAKLCNFFTLDKNPGGDDYPIPDYNMSIESCDTLESNRFQQVIMIGVFEYLDHSDKAFEQIHRILKPGGVAIFAFTGKSEYDDSRGMDKAEVFERLKPLRIIEEYLIYDKKEGEPNSVIVVAEKL
jgi:SAM-dependent methyltransferase